MRISIIITLLFMYSCCKEVNNECFFQIENEISESIHFDKLYCGSATGDYEKIYYSLEAYENDADCVEYTPIPISLGFNGIIVTMGVEVQYAMPNISSYETSVKIEEDVCEKTLTVEYILQTIDTTQLFVHNKTVVVFLEGYDESYDVNLSFTVLPF